MSRWPRGWIAAALALLSPSVSMLYVARPWLAAAYLLALIGLLWAVIGGSTVAAIAASLGLPIIGALHAYIVARSQSMARARPRYTRWYALLAVIASFVAAILLLRVFVIEPFRVPSSAMAPTIMPGQVVLVCKWGFGQDTYGQSVGPRETTAEPSRGDLLIFHPPHLKHQLFIKRLVGLPGDHIELHPGGLRINGSDVPRTPQGHFDAPNRHLAGLQGFHLLEERLPGADSHRILQAPAGRRFAPVSTGSWTVPDDHYFLLGDNRDNSEDSRYWEFVHRSAIHGEVVHVVE